jgi:hypothetical protein
VNGGISRCSYRCRQLLFFACCLVILPSSPLAQTDVSPQQKPQQRGAQDELRTVQASRVEHAPVLDGTLNDPLWQQATPITNFLQREPYEGQPPTERTEVRVLYTKHAVYFGITCFDSNPEGIVATQLRRDATQHLDDYFEIVIDSSHDRRNAYVLQINPLGTQRDALITEEQQSESDNDGDPGWDGIWTSEAHISEIGWTATVAIPFSSLNFMKSTAWNYPNPSREPPTIAEGGSVADCRDKRGSGNRPESGNRH